ncbi:zinc ABC transporter substrate-binding protein [Candidatus Woesearchaeota archaeon]|nr:zinc ABC transporter substrate-binding protein [Candidatus Woesearchaeota archaeon]
MRFEEFFSPVVIIVFILVFALSLQGCGPADSDPLQGSGSEPGTAGRISVVATIFPLYEFVKAVGGSRVDAYLLLPAGSDVHSFDPRPSDVVRIENARMVLYVDESLEPWLTDILDGINPADLAVFEVSQYVDLINSGEVEGQEGHLAEGLAEEEHGHEGADPHFWLDLERDGALVSEIARTLAAMDPDHSQDYYDNAVIYLAELAELDGSYRSGLMNCSKREFITNHDSFTYLAMRYGLTQIPLFGVSRDHEPSPKKVKEITDLAKAHGLKAVFFESSMSPAVAEVIAREIGGRTLVLNPGANLDADQRSRGVSFLGLMRENLESLKVGLECR